MTKCTIGNGCSVEASTQQCKYAICPDYEFTTCPGHCNADATLNQCIDLTPEQNKQKQWENLKLASATPTSDASISVTKLEPVWQTMGTNQNLADVDTD